MRLHNRQIKAQFWTDDDLLDWPMAKRYCYLGLIQMADDSGCLEDRPRSLKREIFRSDLDANITAEMIAGWIAELVDADKITRYTVGRKDCLFLRNFHKHQKLKNPSPPEVPLPPWVTWTAFDSNQRTGKYCVDMQVLTEFLQSSYECLTDGFQHEPNMNQNMNITQHEPEAQSADADECVVDEEDPNLTMIREASEARVRIGPAYAKLSKGKQNGYSAEFEQFWQVYPRHIEKADAWSAWKKRLKEGAAPVFLIAAAGHYKRYCEDRETDIRHIKHPATFLGPQKPYDDFINGSPDEANYQPRKSNSRASPLPPLVPHEAAEQIEHGRCETCGMQWQEWSDSGDLYCPSCEPAGPPLKQEGCRHEKLRDRDSGKFYCPKCQVVPA